MSNYFGQLMTLTTSCSFSLVIAIFVLIIPSTIEFVNPWESHSHNHLSCPNHKAPGLNIELLSMLVISLQTQEPDGQKHWPIGLSIYMQGPIPCDLSQWFWLIKKGRILHISLTSLCNLFDISPVIRHCILSAFVLYVLLISVYYSVLVWFGKSYPIAVICHWLREKLLGSFIGPFYFS